MTDPVRKPTHLGEVMSASEAREMLAAIRSLTGDDILDRALAIASGWPLGRGLLLSKSFATVTVCAECTEALLAFRDAAPETPIERRPVEEIARLAIVRGSGRCDAYEKAGKCKDLCGRECVGELEAIADALRAEREGE